MSNRLLISGVDIAKHVVFRRVRDDVVGARVGEASGGCCAREHYMDYDIVSIILQMTVASSYLLTTFSSPLFACPSVFL